MIFLLSILSVIIYLSNAGFMSYESNCGYVYDVDKVGNPGIFPLDVCITDYDPDHLVYEYTSRIYKCIESQDGSVEIEAYTFADSMTCSTPTAGSGRSVLGSGNTVYSCGNNNVEGELLDDCFVEYKKYTPSDTSTCAGWESSGYTTEYIIVGTCTDTTEGNMYRYARCDPNVNSTTSAEISYVRFNDAECCDLSYSYTGTDAPNWSTDTLAFGCNDGYYIDADSYMCSIPDEADNEDVYTDNTSTECESNAIIMNIWYAIIIGIVASLK